MSSNSLLNHWQSWRRTFHTVRHLKLSQAWYFILRRGIGARRISPVNIELVRRTVVVPGTLRLVHGSCESIHFEFEFLNHRKRFSRDAMDWNPSGTQRLWRYNLHYFDYLREPARDLKEKTALIDSWIASNPQGSESAWEPYTASLRIVNWCMFFWSLPASEIKPEWARSLYDQARWLERNLELHILANHYFENIKALIFAGLFFTDRTAEHWLNAFQKKLVEQLREQFLIDGGHYERSPQYHCILLEDCLDVYALLHGNRAIANLITLNTLHDKIENALDFLALIATPDDDIPLFNDSARGASSRPSVLFNRATALGFAINPISAVLIDLPATGLFGYKCGNDYLLVDCGEIGPGYQPGHTHCDFLSFVLMIDGQWLIVDSGVCEYEPGSMRHYVRSTAAHNTVRVDGAEQSEIWGEFRVGRRASRIAAEIHREKNSIIFEGAYRGFPSLPGRIIHHRKIIIALTNDGKITRLDVVDSITSNSTAMHHAETFLHLHPTLGIAASGENRIDVVKDGKAIAAIHGLSLENSDSWYCEQFGMAQCNPVLQLEIEAVLPSLSYTIETVL